MSSLSPRVHDKLTALLETMFDAPTDEHALVALARMVRICNHHDLKVSDILATPDQPEDETEVLKSKLEYCLRHKRYLNNWEIDFCIKCLTFPYFSAEQAKRIRWISTKVLETLRERV